MTDNRDDDRKNTDDEETYCSLILNDDQIETKISPISEIMKDSRDVLQSNDTTVAAKSFSDLELELFNKVLKRDINESKYRIVGKISSGGMGCVYCVLDRDVRRHTVLKVILPNHKEDPRFVERFLYEARVTGILEHPNIIPLHDFGFLSDYGIYFTMTYVHGDSLYDIIAKLKRNDKQHCEDYDTFALLGLFRKICNAVSYAHSKNIIHRDIKPENVMVGQFGEVILMDWGLAKHLDNPENDFDGDQINEFYELDSPLSTKLGVIKGTPAYLSPEQASGVPSTIDKSSDIFLLGATLYHMFVFNAPFVGYDIKNTIGKARRCDFEPPENFSFQKEKLSKELCRVINKAMAADKKDRYASVFEMIQDIDDILRGKMIFDSRVFEKDEFLMREGEFGTNCYIIVDGKVEVFKTVDKKKMLLETLSRGDIVGEMSLITDQPRTASAMTLERTETVVLNKDIFTRNLKKLPPWMEKTVTALANRLRVTSTKFTDSFVIDRNEPFNQEHPFQL